MDAKCPARLFHREQRNVISVEDDVYHCSCGCIFTWTHAFEWRVLKQSDDIPQQGLLKGSSLEMPKTEKWSTKAKKFIRRRAIGGCK